MDKWLKTGTLKRSASRTEIRTTDLAAMGITVDQKDDNHEVQRPTDWPVQACYLKTELASTFLTSRALLNIRLQELHVDGEIYHPLARSHHQQHQHTVLHMVLESHLGILIKSELLHGTHRGQCGQPERSQPKP
ncbi:hypothetical protein AVEN_92574-1 [Araneus ventricosus]|uniref:Uncharacterized protein n=1 Tax=Araneus ventricosus TaxID=182803 RepID=A0A4Y2AJN0_ARAVE|nr:hypothetical protein AVEN_92574-1 [Araneus ventricosus]